MSNQTTLEEKSVKILRASAGSGKTYRLTYEYIRRTIQNPTSYSSILAVTFTNKATEEMKGRIISSLNTLSTADLSNPEKVEYLCELHHTTGYAYATIKKNAGLAKTLILHDYSNFAVSTIDKFFQRIARAFFKEIGLDFSYEVELSNDRFLEKAAINLIENAASDPQLARLIDRVVGEQLDGNRWNIKSNLVNMGKLLTREDYKESSKNAAQLIAIIKFAAQEIEKYTKSIHQLALQISHQMKTSGVEALDFKGGSRSPLFWVERLASQGEIEPPSESLVTMAQGEDSDWVNQKSKHNNVLLSVASELKPLLNELVEKVAQFTPLYNSFNAVNTNFSTYLLLGNMARELDKLWGENNRLPIHRTTSLIAQIASSTEIPFIYEKLGTHYECYMIDEFQDTSSGQWHGFTPLLHEAISHTQQECVMLIGDVKQAIYRWRGGDWNILATQAVNEFTGRVDALEQLNTNWRSLPNIIEFNNRLLQAIVEADNNEIQALASSLPLQQALPLANSLSNAYRNFEQHSRPNSSGGYVELNICDEPIAQTLKTIAELISNQGYRQKDIAILVRNKKEGSLLAQHLTNAKYNVISDEALFISSSPTVRFIINILKLTANPSDAIALAQHNQHLNISVNTPLEADKLSLISELSLCSPITAIEKIIETYNLSTLETTYLQALYQAIYTISTTQSPDLRQFLTWWDEIGKNTSLNLPQNQDAITILTIHKSKGLQFPCVILPYASWTLNPLTNSSLWATTDIAPFDKFDNCLVNYTKNLADSCFNHDYVQETIYSHIDNINLLYVALTRAENSLYITTPTRPKSNSVAALINQCVVHIADKKDGTCMSFGELTKYTPKNKEQKYTSLSFSSFDSNNPTNRTATTLPHYRVNSEVSSKTTSPDKRFHGILMHELFSQVNNCEDISPAIEKMVAKGRITIEQSRELQANVDKAFENSVVADWFSGRWEVFNERAIILPQQSQTRRPDRVLLSSEHTVVVDYKFGMQKPIHRTQVMEYADILRAMGYPAVKTYLWYVTLEEVVEL